MTTVNSAPVDIITDEDRSRPADRQISASFYPSPLSQSNEPQAFTLNNKTWSKKQYAVGFLIAALASMLMLLSGLAHNIGLMSFTLAPSIFISALMAFLLFNHNEATYRATLFSDSLTGQLTMITFVLATYCGITAGLILQSGGIPILANLIIWLSLTATSVSAIGRLSLSRFIITFALFFLPLAVMLISTGDPSFIILTVQCIVVSGGAIHLYISTRNRFLELESCFQAQGHSMLTLQERHQEFLEHSRNWGWETSRHHHLTFLTPNFETLTNITSDALITTSPSQALVPFGNYLNEKDQHSLQEKLDGQASFENLEVKFYPEGFQDGPNNHQQDNHHERPYKVYAVHANAIHNRENEFAGYRGWAVDISQSAALKEKQKTFQTTLERKVLFRTKHLHEEISNLNTEKVDYEKQISAQSKLISNISTRIHYSAQKITHSAKQFTRENRNFAIMESRSLQHLAENIPYLMSMETKQNHNTNMIVRLDDLVRDTVHTLNHRAKDKAVNLVFPVLSGLEIFGDNAMLGKALYEIGLNAINYSPARSIIKIKVMNNAKGIDISVYDNGREINPKIIEHITSLLAQPKIGFLDMITQEHGMGLSIAAKMIHTHNGSLHFERKDGNQGNIISIRLSRARLLNS